jgi:hypothetical protein
MSKSKGNNKTKASATSIGDIEAFYAKEDIKSVKEYKPGHLFLEVMDEINKRRNSREAAVEGQLKRVSAAGKKD